MPERNLKIDIIGFIEDVNIGDLVIGETCEHLVKTICKKNNIKANIALHTLFPPPNWSAYWITRFLRYRCRRQRKNFYNAFTFFVVALSYFFFGIMRRYYSSIFKKSDLVIFAGGGMLKFVSQEFWAADYCIIKYCQKHNIPVYFNAIGIEHYDENNLYSRLIKSLINEPCIKGITTRDDVESLKRYINNATEDQIVGDPALWSSDLYLSNKKTDVVGIGLIRAGIFRVNGHDMKEVNLINFYCNIINQLEKKGYKWQLFTNGTVGDYNLGLKILNQLGLEIKKERLADRPTSGQELINLISSYKGIIANRMHAHIIATSYGIPTIGLIWNEKLRWYVKHIGCSERFFEPEEINNIDKIIETFEYVLIEGCSKLNTENLKEKTYKHLEKIIKDF